MSDLLGIIVISVSTIGFLAYVMCRIVAHVDKDPPDPTAKP